MFFRKRRTFSAGFNRHCREYGAFLDRQRGGGKSVPGFYSKKTISATKAIMPSGDINKDMREIKLYFKDFKGKHPENFALGEI